MASNAEKVSIWWHHHRHYQNQRWPCSLRRHVASIGHVDLRLNTRPTGGTIGINTMYVADWSVHHLKAVVNVILWGSLLRIIRLDTPGTSGSSVMQIPVDWNENVVILTKLSSLATPNCLTKGLWAHTFLPVKSIILSCRNMCKFLAATKQLYKWYFPSVRLSVRPSVRPSVCLSVTPFWLCSHHRIIMKFSGVITNDQSKVHAKGQGQRSKVKVTEVTTQLHRFRTVTPVWIHIWWWNDAYSLMLLRRGALLFFKVIRQISRSHGSKNCRIWPRLGVSGL